MKNLVETFSHTFEIISADTPELIDIAYHLRYQVYCLENPYEEAHCFEDGRESDEYDARSVHALVKHRPSGHYVGVVRLILPDADNYDKPFPIESHSNKLIEKNRRGGMHLPRQSLAEISRFCVSKEFKQRIAENSSESGVSAKAYYGDGVHEDAYHRRMLPHVIIGLFAGVIRMSVEHNITHWLAVMEPSLLRLLGRCGIFFEPVGSLVDHRGLRQPAMASAKKIVEGIYAHRPDIWEIITDNGKLFPIDVKQVRREGRVANGD